MNEIREMSMELSDGSISRCIVEIARSEPWTIHFYHSAFGQAKFEAESLFGALTSLREMLEGRDIRLLCNGSRKDVVVSGMSRQMGGGRKGYVVRVGVTVRRQDVVDIFDYANPSDVATVREQREFYNEWVSSL